MEKTAFTELTAAENAEIDAARKKGFYTYFPSAVPSNPEYCQAKWTLNAARNYMTDLKEARKK